MVAPKKRVESDDGEKEGRRERDKEMERADEGGAGSDGRGVG